jgi:phosphoribosylamine--glycine ligase
MGGARGALPAGAPRISPRAAVCVVMASAGYPEKPRSGDRITVSRRRRRSRTCRSSTPARGARAAPLVTAGGRVLAVCALGDDLAAARTRAYEAADLITWNGAHYRRDIGGRA